MQCNIRKGPVLTKVDDGPLLTAMEVQSPVTQFRDAKLRAKALNKASDTSS